jgi:biotin carboxyl carrier protein
MELIVRQHGRERRVVLEGDSGSMKITIDGRSYRVETVAAGTVMRSLVIDGQQVEVGLRSRGDGRFEVTGERGSEVVEVLNPLTVLAEKTHGLEAGRGAEKVSAYMPGRVVDILVSPGEQVATGQGILVLEAMKMENEIQAGREGVVRNIFVATGQAVEAGDSLYEIE